MFSLDTAVYVIALVASLVFNTAPVRRTAPKMAWTRAQAGNRVMVRSRGAK